MHRVDALAVRCAFGDQVDAALLRGRGVAVELNRPLRPLHRNDVVMHAVADVEQRAFTGADQVTGVTRSVAANRPRFHDATQKRTRAWSRTRVFLDALVRDDFETGLRVRVENAG